MNKHKFFSPTCQMVLQLVLESDDDDNISDNSEETVIEEFKCQLCASQFMTKKSLKIHRYQCEKAQKTREIKSTPPTVPEENVASTSTAATAREIARQVFLSKDQNLASANHDGNVMDYGPKKKYPRFGNN